MKYEAYLQIIGNRIKKSRICSKCGLRSCGCNEIDNEIIKLCEIYFNIACGAIGKKKVCQMRDKILTRKNIEKVKRN